MNIPVILYLLVQRLRSKEYVWAALLGTGIVNLVFWLVTAPHMRYGGLYIYTVVALTLGAATGLSGWAFGSSNEDHAALAAGVEACPVREKTLRVAVVAVMAVFLLQYGARIFKIPEMEAKDFVRQPDYLAWPAEQYPVDGVHIWMPTEGDLIGYAAFPATSQGNQLNALRLRGESFREGFRHE